MEVEKLRKIITNFNLADSVNNIGTSDDNFVSLLAVEQVLKNKQNELLEKIKEYEKHMSKLLNCECKVVFKSESPTSVRAFQGRMNRIDLILNDSFFSKKDSKIWLASWGKKTSDLLYYKGDKLKRKNPYNNLIHNDSVTDEFIEYYFNWNENFVDKNGLDTNIGLCLDIFQDEFDGLNVVLSDREEIERTNYRSGFNFSNFVWHVNNEMLFHYNFFYHRDVMNDTRTVYYKNDECKTFLNESQIADIYSTLKVDISSFSEELQEEMRRYEGYYKVGIHEQADKEKNELIRMQRERVLEAYKELKRVTELLANLKTEVNLEKIRLEDIENLFFKNGGKPNENGAIEVDDMFRNNMFLRLIDLRRIDLTGVDIRNIDFSGTNIHIDPQTIYNKDMTNVNASGVKFSPFSDKFDDVILDGAIIDDWEAAIDLNTLKSYNNQTVIPEISNKTK